MKALIGVDIGTQGTKAALFDETGRVLATAFAASQLHRPATGVVEEDANRQYGSVCETIAACVRKAKVRDIAGIGIDGQMAGVVGIGRDGRAVTPYDSWLDTRCAPQIRAMDKAAGEQVLAKTGCPPSFNHGPKILWWKQTRAKAYKRIHAFVQPGGYAAMRLCGLDANNAYIDKTYLHFSGFADNHRATWDAGLCRQFGVDIAKLPAIVDPQTVIGELSAEAAKACGLKSGVPVVAGCGDTAASFLACGAVTEGVGVDVAGTASVFAATTGSFRPDRKHRMVGCGRSAVPGLWHPYAYINGGGMNLEWFRREFGGRSLELLDQLASEIKVNGDAPFFVPHLGGRVCPAQPDLRGAWVGLGWDHTMGHLYRAVLEGVALEYAAYQRVLRTLYPDFNLRELRITGGGEKSELWNGLKADVLQTTVVRVEQSVGAPTGSAMLAGWGVGVLKDLPTAAKQWITMGDRRRPSRRFDRKRLETYETLLRQLDGITK
jgi:xylulokinase